ncbi:PfkB family carbohydrate kinase [Tianweitania sp.]|uniref:PfkB family carbohydrate kinase n=1 Tax=Tianweitania sp. TaxID=2021634 RepID=UPI0028981527|nr:PfkB family carbohydrate kinase [Tianweitania sp.]
MADLTTQEAAVLEQISRNPFAGQQEIADALGIARSTVAAHIVQLIKQGHILGRGYVLPEPGHIVCIGGAVFDRKHRLQSPLAMETSNPVDSVHSFGGVARNVAESLALLGERPLFISAVGDDQTGQHLLNHLRGRGVDLSGVIMVPGQITAEYSAVLSPDGQLVFGMDNMRLFDLLTPAALARIWSHLAAASWVFAETNLPAETLEALIRRQGGGRYKLAIDAVSIGKVRKLPNDLTGIDLLFLNADEAAILLSGARATTLDEAMDAAQALQGKGAGMVQLSLGSKGVVIAGEGTQTTLPSIPATVIDLTGAGDAMVAGTLHSLLSGKDLAAAAALGNLMSALTIETTGTVRADLSLATLESHARMRMPAPSAGQPA